MSNDNLIFISNNVKGIQFTEKRIKLFEYLRNYVTPNGFIFLQETHSSSKDEKRWKDEFKGQLFFSHGKTNSCGVAIGFYGTKSFELINKIEDKAGRILVIEAKIDDDTLLLVNIYNSNTESEQLLTLSELCLMLDNIDNLSNKKIIFGGDFNMIFDPILEAQGGNPVLKKKSIAKIIQIKENLDLCDIWRIRNPNRKRYTFRQTHVSGFIQRRLDYFFISNLLQDSVKKTDILASFSTDHSPIMFSLRQSKEESRGKGLWKFNSSLITNNNYVDQMKNHINATLKCLDEENIIDEQLRWEYLKYEIRKFTVQFSKENAKKMKLERVCLENRIKHLESDLKNQNGNEEYDECKNKLEQIYQEKVDGIRIRSKCDWYEYGEKSSKFFLNLEKNRATQNHIRTILSNEKEVDDQKEINNELYSFYKTLFSQKKQFPKHNFESYLNQITIPKLTKERLQECEGEITEAELFKALQSMENNKTPGNDGLTKEFYVTFWMDVKIPLILSVKKAFYKKELSTSQKQAIIKLIEKKEKDKRFIKNWRPISLLNVDVKLISKVLATRLRNVLPNLISSSQTAYVKNRFISEGGRLISDILEVTDYFKINGLLLTIDIEKAFDSVNHLFLISVLDKYGFGKEFIEWIKILLKNQESCVINGGRTTKYFKLERGTRQGDPISAYLFILVLEIVFLIIKKNKNIKGIDIFSHNFLYTAYADDTTFFLKDEKSVIEVMKVLDEFSLYSGLKPHRSKCEIAGIGVLKGEKVALCGMECINLNDCTIKILGIHYSYNKKLENENNFKKYITKIEKVLKYWRMRQLSIEGKITIFKTLAISKIVHLALVTNVPVTTINQLNKIQKEFIWKGGNPKIKHSTLCNTHENGGLKNVDISSKIVSLQCSWIKRLYDDSFHSWKVIPLYLIKKQLGEHFKFHSNLKVKNANLKRFPQYYKEIISNWSKYLSFPPSIPSTIASQIVWYNKYILIDNDSIYIPSLSKKQINYVGQFFENDGKTKMWEKLRTEYNLPSSKKFVWMQIINALPKSWKETFLTNEGNLNNLVIHDHHLLKKNQIYSLNKLNSKELYNIQIASNDVKPTSQLHYEQVFQSSNLEWKEIYLLPRLVTLDSNLRIFQYKLLNNILYLNKMLFKFGKVTSPLCSFCKLEDETPLHLFYFCSKTQILWNHLQQLFLHN